MLVLVLVLVMMIMVMMVRRTKLVQLKLMKQQLTVACFHQVKN